MFFRLTVRLKQIAYSGDNIGNDLSFQFNVKGHGTLLKSNISLGQRRSFNEILFQENVPEGSISFPIRVDITEKDPVFHDTGSGSSYWNIQLQPSEPQTHSFNAEVIASGRDKGKKATFSFMLEANVENVIKVDITSITTAEQNQQIRRTFNLPNPFLAEGDRVEVIGDIIPDLVATTTFHGISDPANHGAFNPVRQQATDEVISVFTPAARDININADVTRLGYGLQANQVCGDMPVTIIEQRLIQMIWSEGRSRTQRERIGLGWVARNRIGDAGFAPNNQNLIQVLTVQGQFATSTVTHDTAPAQERARYDEIVDESGQVQQGNIADPTLGSIGFVTPRGSDISIILNAFDTGATGDAQDLGIRNPGFVGDYQTVLLNTRQEYEQAAQTPDTPQFSDNPFVFFRRKTPNDPTIRFNTGGN